MTTMNPPELPMRLRKLASRASATDPVAFLKGVLESHSSPTEAAATLQVSENTLRRWRKATGL